MKKKIFIIILLLFMCIPFLVSAEECDLSEVKIVSIEEKEKSDSVKVLSDPEINDKNIKLGLKMSELNSSITYTVILENTSSDNYTIDDESFVGDSDYIRYSIEAEDGTNLLESSSDKVIYLTVSYFNEVDEELFENGLFSLTSTLSFYMQNNEKEKEIGIITVPAIVEDTKNPLTNVFISMIIIIIMFVSLLVSYLLFKNKKKFKTYSVIIICLSVSLPVLTYALCKAEFTVESQIVIDKGVTLYDAVVAHSKGDNICAAKYDGPVTDEVNKTVQATNVYFDKCIERNVIFGGYCWQVIRTTETKGVKMIYNGEPINGKCESTRPNHQGVIGSNSVITDLSSNYLYSSEFDYDLENGTFTLVNPVSKTWSDSTYESIMGKFTCKNMTGTCTTLYGINGYSSNTSAYASNYIINTIVRSELGTTTFNADFKSLGMSGYMFNAVYNYSDRQPGATVYRYGSSFTYDSNTNMYTLAGNIQDIGDYPSNYKKVGNSHYTCWNTSGTCEKIYYVYYAGTHVMYNNYEAFYIELSNGESVNDAVNKMINNDDINKYDSNVKAFIDNWYRINMVNYTDRLENNVYCNDRKSVSLGGWDPASGESNAGSYLNYKAASLTTNISCGRVIDQFSVSNDKAKLKYPVALFMEEEYNNLESNDLRKTSGFYWSLSPARMYQDGVYIRGVIPSGDIYYVDNGDLFYSNAVRPAISLKNKSFITGGTGTESDPWIVE